MNNLNYFKASIEHKEQLIDPDYAKSIDHLIIPDKPSDSNKLTISWTKTIDYLDKIDYLMFTKKLEINDSQIAPLLCSIIKELKTKGMNLSPFCQYFNVHNMNYSIFDDEDDEEKLNILKYIIPPYILTRHRLYKLHGYSNVVMQTLFDNYSHKRKGSYGVKKITKILTSLGLFDLVKSNGKQLENYYIESDKNGKKLYKKIAKKLGINLSAAGKTTQKYPDAFIKIKNDYFIIEQKNMKEGGGGQDKQTLEITDFIDKKPEIKNLHYVTFGDGIYFNRIDEKATAKTLDQYTDIVNSLKKHPENYFVNSYGFEKLISDYLHS